MYTGKGKFQALIEDKQKQLKKLEGIRDGKTIIKSNLSSKDAKFARLHPELATAVDIAEISHRAGVEQSKSGALIGGSISIIKNLVAVIKDDKDVEDAVIDVVKETSSAVAVSYATGFSGAAIKGAMQNSKLSFTRALSKTNLPATLVSITLETSKTLAKYIKGEIDGVECFEELGEKGTGMLSSAMFASLGTAAAVSVFGKSAVIGQIVIPIPVVGGLIGGMVGYALCSACYGELMKALKDAKIARKNRLKIEAECEKAIQMIREYRSEMEVLVSTYLSDNINTFHIAFNDIKNALSIGDIDGFITGANIITKKLGGKPQFNNMSEFDSLMNSSDKLHL